MFLVIVGVHRGVGQGQVLDGGLLGGNNSSVGLAHSHIDDFQFVAERTIANLELAQPLHAALADHPDLRIQLVPPGPVILETDCLVIMLEDVGFLRIIRRRGRLH